MQALLQGAQAEQQQLQRDCESLHEDRARRRGQASCPMMRFANCQVR